MGVGDEADNDESKMYKAEPAALQLQEAEEDRQGQRL